MSAQVSAAPASVPELQNGDLLDSREFLRRYDCMPEVKKAELVEGIVYMGSPVSLAHSEADSLVQTWLGTFAAHTPGLSAHSNTTVILDGENTVQPDACLIAQDQPASARAGEAGYAEGPPEVVFEVSVSSVSLDNHAKKRVYQKSGVPEYVVWRVRDRELDWWRLEDQAYGLVLPDEMGLISSARFPDLVLNVGALLSNEADKVLTTLQQAIARQS